MGVKQLAEKVAEYNDRLEQGKVEKIKPDHVKKVQKKLQKKTAELEAEIAATGNEDKKVRLKRKLAIAREHAERAEWLLDKIT
jgi:thioredoxin reductase